jgi:hypothetical protein
LEDCLSQANSTLTSQIPIPGSGESKIIPSCTEDVWCEVKDKLTAVTDSFNFYDSLEFYDKPVSIRKETLGGAIRILDDCIDKLNPLFQKQEAVWDRKRVLTVCRKKFGSKFMLCLKIRQ